MKSRYAAKRNGRREQSSSRLRIITRINQCNNEARDVILCTFSVSNYSSTASFTRVEEPTIFTPTVDYVNGNQGTIEAQFKGLHFVVALPTAFYPLLV